MRHLSCPVCRNRLFFENGHCTMCGTDVVFDLCTLEMKACGEAFSRCANHGRCGCNWTAREAGGLCLGCGLTQTIPPVDDPVQLRRWADVEAAKRRLIYDLSRLELAPWPLVSADHPLAFRILVSEEHGGSGKVVMGHEGGLITIDATEADTHRREARRVKLGEPYRTLLGHMRHETGHYLWDLLFELDGFADAFRRLFGDERADYGDALERHYAQGAPSDWHDAHISSYATMHPWEDWAETFAHYLHMRDGLETARDSGLIAPERLAAAGPDIRSEIGAWIELAIFMNTMSRGLGHGDAYPFVIPGLVRDKLAFIDTWIAKLATGAPGRSPASGRAA
ncbi:MAG: putative zinc-binding peptidase [Rhizobiaceae bacterium]|nr:putative zinc-binding peptidase [Rhizobiaceae bacterium]